MTRLDRLLMVTTSLQVPKSLLDWIQERAIEQHARHSTQIRQWLEQRHDAANGVAMEDLASPALQGSRPEGQMGNGPVELGCNDRSVTSRARHWDDAYWHVASVGSGSPGCWCVISLHRGHEVSALRGRRVSSDRVSCLSTSWTHDLVTSWTRCLIALWTFLDISVAGATVPLGGEPLFLEG